MREKRTVRTLRLSVAALVLTLLLGAGTVYAWFVGGSTVIDNLIIKTANVEIETQLFQVRDFNEDGIYDTEILDGREIPLLVRDETGKPVDLTLGGTAALTQRMYPGKTLTFVLRVRNAGSNDCVLNVGADVEGGTKGGANEVYSVCYEDAAGAARSVRLTDAHNRNRLTGADHAVPAGGTVDFLFGVRMERLEALRAADPARFGAMTDLNAYLDLKCVFSLYVELEQRI